MRARLIVGLAALLAVSVSGQRADEKGFIRVAPEDLQWRPGTGTSPDQAIVAGDPSKPGLYVVRVRFKPGVMTRPHFHREDRLAVVLTGTWWTGTGSVFDPGATLPLKAGSFMKHPAGAAHFDGAKDEEVIVQIVGEGPSATTLVGGGPGER
jgi:quercetin dioxygenase-like cupin family protein